MAAYMQITNIKGNATESGHKGWIELNDFEFKIERPITTHIGRANARSIGHPDFGTIKVSKFIDSSSHYLFTNACSRPPIDQVVIHICHAGDGLKVESAYTLHDVYLTNFHRQLVGGRQLETFTLDYTKIEDRYTPYDNKQKAGSPVTCGYDLDTAALI